MQWEWRADEKWIPYDIPSVVQIETAFQEKRPRVDLSQGFFEGKRGYLISFEPSNHRGGRRSMYQLNQSTGMMREVRRIGNDDEALFAVVPFASLTEANDKCAICLEEFEDERNAERRAVKLPKCANHFFHRTCISAWVKLKGCCPYCRTAI